MFIRYTARTMHFSPKCQDWIAETFSFVEKIKRELRFLPYWELPNINHYNTKLFTRTTRRQGFVQPWATTLFCFYSLTLIINNLTSGHPEMGTLGSFQRLFYIYLLTLKDICRKTELFIVLDHEMFKFLLSYKITCLSTDTCYLLQYYWCCCCLFKKKKNIVYCFQ